MNKGLFIGVFVLFLSFSLKSSGAPSDETVAPKKMDGVTIEAVETYVNPRRHDISFSLGLYPFDPYYTGFGMSFAYSYHFSNRFAWEIIQGTYTFSSEKALTAQLAEKYQVNPETIDRMNALVSSSVVYTPIYGKFVLSDKVIQYFRASLVGGLGVVNTTTDIRGAFNLGVRWEVHVNRSFSWRFEVRDTIAIKSGVGDIHYVVFGLGSSLFF